MNAQSWTDTVDDYARYVELATGKYAEQVIDFADLQSKSGIKILDVACGTGVVPEAIVKKLSPDISVLATDYAQGMVDFARSKIENQGWRNVKFQVEDGMNLTLSDASMDVVFCVFGVMLMPDGGKALSEFYRVLVPGGKAVFATWASQDMQPLMWTALAKAKGQEPAELPWIRGWGDLEFCQEQLKAAGFQETSGEHISGEMEAGEEELDGFIGSIVRNPAVRAGLLNDMSDDDIKVFKAAMKDAIVEKYGKQEVYKFNAVANVALGIK
ncbi:S-adenosyl-L-methionine-dependent methyltransferase [Umbelopsis sp. PMI_123]|nr:S-adenosyl-L-methionine-dependent methyltransferase [Umbelopsis sp. PMI_123]